MGAPNMAGARRAGPDDMAAVAALRDRALDELRVLRGGALYVAREAVQLPDGADPERAVWVGVLADAIVGYLSGRVVDRLGRVDAIYVDADCRAVGVGEAMMGAALEWFRDRGCSGVDATALPGARATKNFFEETGFTARLLVMHKEL
ncbi:MAG: GNAT family N-acetyltransferase [Acidimicrobiales bacterium]